MDVPFSRRTACDTQRASECPRCKGNDRIRNGCYGIAFLNNTNHATEESVPLRGPVSKCVCDAEQITDEPAARQHKMLMLSVVRVSCRRDSCFSRNYRDEYDTYDNAALSVVPNATT